MNHISYVDFGAEVNPNVVILDMLNKFQKVSSSVDAKLIASDVYDTAYGIYNHLAPDASLRKPLATVAMYEQEDLTQGNLKRYLMKEYLDAKILTLFGLTFNEFIQQTREDIRLMVEESHTYRSHENHVNTTAANDVLASINRIDKK